jgi:hypothetical protein
MNEQLDQAIDMTEKAIIGMFSRDVIDRGRAMMAEDTRIYGDPTAKNIHDNTAQNYIYNVAGVAFPDRPVTPQLHAAARLMSLSLALVTTAATPDVLASAVKEIGVLAKRLSDSQKIASDIDKANSDDLDHAGSEAQSILQRISPSPISTAA